jgi:mycothiol system anti-sigma-R factor
MNCEQATDLMDGYLDGELDPITSQAIEQHLRDCRNCEQAYKAHTALTHAISRGAPYYKAPRELRERIQSSLQEEIAKQPARTVAPDAAPLIAKKQPEPRSIVFGASWKWLALAAAIVFAAVIAWNVLPGLQRPDAEQFLATQLIASHVRSLMANHLADVPSSDQHTVKPWLDAKLDFAPPVVDLTSAGFPLIGGRLDYLDNRPVAALIYQRRKHFINLFVWPASDASRRTASKEMSHQGYHLLHWIEGDFNYWAVSDVNKEDLQNFQHLFEEQITAH